ncbi:DNA-binding transcriptional regulator, ArsR family [Nonomuraea solani]|uniref:DNA-binding transcriptional regulator, ArsR family n=1 Tax=Nonomuraea solani TaxID=1144553 RepID=A0A1H6F106_9ACTN|nr:helix-turn-helix domain-containing protein [Nonomuraea solani]SEH03830.1 DNA-binding transcriptional regulator, ArsR family [Nonomuraea solani]
MATEPVMHTPAAMKALASPLRREILRHLANHGPATSTTLAKAMGQNTGTTSYHLRMLSDTGFVTELHDRAKGRERWWDIVKADRRMPAREELTDAEQDLAERLGDSRLAEDLRMLSAFAHDRNEDGDWQQGSRAGTFMTKAQLMEFHEEYLKLVRRFGADRDHAPEGARMVLLRWIGFPDPRGS